LSEKRGFVVVRVVSRFRLMIATQPAIIVIKIVKLPLPVTRQIVIPV